MAYSFVLTGGGTGGHVFPALAVARVLRERGHSVLFIGSREKMEARLVPEAGFKMRFVRTGALNRVDLGTRIRSAFRIPAGVVDAWRILGNFRPQAVFSTGGYVTAPVMLAAILRRVPLVILEPNATPGLANRMVRRFVHRALLGFESTQRWFGQSRSEVVGLPVRSEFFRIERKAHDRFTILITGGSLGARTLNRASRESWGLFRQVRTAVRIIHQSGPREHEALEREFKKSELEGEVVPFIPDMPEAFAQADLVVARAGAGSVNEIAAGGMASVLVPLPFAADDHQRRNAEAFVEAGAATMVLDAELDGKRLFEEIEKLRQEPAVLEQMRTAATKFAKPDAASRAADILEAAARQSTDRTGL
jgi:UDP-N-acetylglucosamine--N-acetylmuramyl-(pentapeptide) pyrophosphoryl-undecaprenol N-acetylglucosamine transferase